MNDYTLAEVFNTVYSEEFSEFDNPLGHLFSRRHRKAIKEILYPQTISTFTANRKKLLKKRVIIMLIVILLSALGITAGAAISRGFTRKEHCDNTELFAVNAENAPKTIEYMYYLPKIPEGYEPHEQFSDSTWFHSSLINPLSHRTITFNQHVKEGYKSHFNNEHAPLEDIKINGHKGVYLNYSFDDVISGIIIWDNDDYILVLSGDFDKKQLIELAKTLKILDK